MSEAQRIASNEATAASFAGRFDALDCVVVHGHYRALSTARGTRTNKSVAVRSGCGSHLERLRASDRPASPRRILRHPLSMARPSGRRWCELDEHADVMQVRRDL